MIKRRSGRICQPLISPTSICLHRRPSATTIARCVKLAEADSQVQIVLSDDVCCNMVYRANLPRSQFVTRHRCRAAHSRSLCFMAPCQHFLSTFTTKTEACVFAEILVARFLRRHSQRAAGKVQLPPRTARIYANARGAPNQQDDSGHLQCPLLISDW